MCLGDQDSGSFMPQFNKPLKVTKNLNQLKLKVGDCDQEWAKKKGLIR